MRVFKTGNNWKFDSIIGRKKPTPMFICNAIIVRNDEFNHRRTQTTRISQISIVIFFSTYNTSPPRVASIRTWYTREEDNYIVSHFPQRFLFA